MSDFDITLFDTEAYRLARVRLTPGQFAWAGASVASLPPAARDTWQTSFRTQFARALGDLDEWSVPPPDPVVHDVRSMDGYRREAVSFATRPGLRAFGYFLVPDDCHPNMPAVICLPGHGRGIDSLVGIDADGSQCTFTQRDAGMYALECVAQGYPTLALEMIGFGVRRDGAARAAGPGVSSCAREAMAALMVGETLPGWRVWDVCRGVDYLQSRTEYVDANRISVMGISGGGLVALFTAALETRLAAAVVSCYFNMFAASVLSISHCVDNYVPGLLRLGEMPDLAALIAPRVLFVEGGRADPLFPVAALEGAIGQAQEVYAAFGAPRNFGSHVFDGGHEFSGAEAFPFLARRLTSHIR